MRKFIDSDINIQSERKNAIMRLGRPAVPALVSETTLSGCPEGEGRRDVGGNPLELLLCGRVNALSLA